MLKEVTDLAPVVSLGLVALGWPIGYFFARRSEIASRRIDRRVENLCVVFQKLNQLRTFQIDRKLDIINILREIGDRLELFGSREEVESFHKASEQFVGGGSTEIHKLINLIRNDLRNSLSMKTIRSNVPHFKIVQ